MKKCTNIIKVMQTELAKEFMSRIAIREALEVLN